MKIRVLSDLHLEFGDYIVEPLPDDIETVLVLAGDLTVAASRVSKNVFIPFLQRCAGQFLSIVMVMGNHEHYHGDVTKSKAILDKLIEDAGLVGCIHILENETVYIHDVAFIGATLWTDCSTNGESVSNSAEVLWHGMTESKISRYLENKLSVWNTIDMFNVSKNYILNQIEHCKDFGYKTVVVSHHCPSSKSTHAMYAGQDFNMFFVSQMDLEIAEANPDVWIHGHTHHAFDYILDPVICKTRVICNPRGYHGRESPPESRGFNPLLTIEV
jgi:DNA repair exonuclease SbcCD nuclease subunit